jgi:hypothetical protein
VDFNYLFWWPEKYRCYNSGMLDRRTERNNSNDLRVDVEGSADLYQLLQELTEAYFIRGLPYNSETGPIIPLYFTGDLSMVNFNDRLFSTGLTRMILTRPLEPEVSEADYTISTILELSGEEMKKPPFGYYSSERLQAVMERLRDKGLAARFRDEDSVPIESVRVMLSSRGCITIPIDNTDASIDIQFGYKSREILRLITFYGYQAAMADGRIGDAIMYNKALQESVSINNERILIVLQGLSNSYPNLLGRKEFIDYLRFYGRVYEKALRVLYEEGGIELPQKRIVLQTPPHFDIGL